MSMPLGSSVMRDLNDAKMLACGDFNAKTLDSHMPWPPPTGLVYGSCRPVLASLWSFYGSSIATLVVFMARPASNDQTPCP